ncbi:ATP-dependent nuclease [Peribacillus frigoritolerans]|uniref:ATP-dependent nuclease n=1 Tax=Peribacillus frigoritolerans TaxID=450367 RepID=UPI003B8E4D64
MTYPFNKVVYIHDLFSSQPLSIEFHVGLTTFLGPNGSGKSQVLRALKDQLEDKAHKRKRLLAAGRLSQLETFRSNYDGMKGINYEQASFDGTNLREYRHQSESAIGDLHTLSVRPDIQIKVSERLITLFKRNIFIDWDAGNLKIKFSTLAGAPYSAAREESGLLHLVTILTALYDDEVGVLLLDEPEVSLHPQLQAFLFQEIKRVAGGPANRSKKMIVIATHSTELLDVLVPEDLTKIVFLKDTQTPLVQIDPQAAELVRELLTRLGQAHKAAFFSSKPFLVCYLTLLFSFSSINKFILSQTQYTLIIYIAC